MKVIYQVTQGCVYCGACVQECPVSAVTMTNQGAVIDAGRCIGCGRCAANCCAEAIERIEVPEEGTKGTNDD